MEISKGGTERRVDMDIITVVLICTKHRIPDEEWDEYVKGEESWLEYAKSHGIDPGGE